MEIINIKLKEILYSFILNDPSVILEPSIGQGDLIEYVKNKKPKIKFDMYEIDTTIKLLNKVEKEKIIYFIISKFHLTYRALSWVNIATVYIQLKAVGLSATLEKHNQAIKSKNLQNQEVQQDCRQSLHI